MKLSIVKLTVIAGLQALLLMPALSQQSLPNSSLKPVSCLIDLEDGVVVIVTSRIADRKLSSVEFRFESRTGARLKIDPNKIVLYRLPTENKLFPTRFERKIEGQTTTVNFAMSNARAESIAGVFLEGAVLTETKDLGRKTNFGSRVDATEQSSEIDGRGRACQKGLANWIPKDYLSSRLASKDKAVGMEATVEVIGNDFADPGQLLFAAHWLFQADNPKLGLETYYKAMYRLRFETPPSGAMALPFLIGAVAPAAMSYATSNTPQLIEVLEKTIQWDEKTFIQWADSVGVSPNDARLQKSRQSTKTLTQELIKNLRNGSIQFDREVQKYTDPYLD